jgi:hypothetical protein
MGQAIPKDDVNEEDQLNLQADPKHAGPSVDRSGVRQVPSTSTPWSRRKHRLSARESGAFETRKIRVWQCLRAVKDSNITLAMDWVLTDGWLMVSTKSFPGIESESTAYGVETIRNMQKDS